MKNWLTDRLAWIETQSRGTSGLARPPTFNQYGGAVPGGFDLTMSDPNGWAGAEVYYTTDGSDPRVAAVTPQGTATTFLDGDDACEVLVPSTANGGSTLTVAQWTGTRPPRRTPPTGLPGPRGRLRKLRRRDLRPDLFDTDVDRRCAATNETCYIRIPFTVGSQAEIDALTQLTLQMRYDDGFIAYLNGVPIASANAPGSPAWNSGATGQHGDGSAVNYINFPAASFIGDLQPGANMLAIHGLNDGVNSSDALWGARLVGSAGEGGDPSPTAQVYSSPLDLTASATIKARVYDGSRWSPLSSGLFVVDATPASASNLVVSEINYRPGQPTAAEEAEGFLSRGDFEFIELMNIHPTQAVTLEGVTFTQGITFDGFDETLPADALVLAPGARVILVDTAEAFNFRYAGHAAVIAGEFAGSLSNDGEQIILLDANGATIKDFTYNDVEPWPVAADGDGFTLVLKDPPSNPDHSDPFSWRSSVAIGGSPGGTDSIPFSGDPDDDGDADGLSAFYEYATGTSDGDGSQFALPVLSIGAVDVGGTIDDYLLFEFTINLAAEGVDYEVQKSTDLSAWSDAGGDLVLRSTSNNGDGTATVRYRSSAAFDGAELRAFYRLSVSG